MSGGRASQAGRASCQKGNRTERAIVRLLQERGLAAERVPLSGAARGRFGGDVSVPVLGRDLRAEVKFGGNGPLRLAQRSRSPDHPRRSAGNARHHSTKTRRRNRHDG